MTVETGLISGVVLAVICYRKNTIKFNLTEVKEYVSMRTVEPVKVIFERGVQ
ncbi:hypothetical protein ES708_34773 [subsurface metagenome]